MKPISRADEFQIKAKYEIRLRRIIFTVLRRYFDKLTGSHIECDKRSGCVATLEISSLIGDVTVNLMVASPTGKTVDDYLAVSTSISKQSSLFRLSLGEAAIRAQSLEFYNVWEDPTLPRKVLTCIIAIINEGNSGSKSKAIPGCSD